MAGPVAISLGNRVARLLPQCCILAEVTNRTCKGQIWLRTAAKALDSFTGTGGRSVVRYCLHGKQRQAPGAGLSETILEKRVTPFYAIAFKRRASQPTHQLSSHPGAWNN